LASSSDEKDPPDPRPCRPYTPPWWRDVKALTRLLAHDLEEARERQDPGSDGKETAETGPAGREVEVSG